MVFEENAAAETAENTKTEHPSVNEEKSVTPATKEQIKSSGLKKIPVILLRPRAAATLLYGKRKLVILVRHGQTDWNLCLRLQGRESVPLNECGIEQSRECAALLKEAVTCGLEISSVWSSPLSRAQKTAEIIADEITNGVFETEELLIERDYGSLSGLTYEERRRLFPKGERQAENLESIPDTAERMKKALVSVTSKSEGKCVLCVSHGGITNALFLRITRDRIGTGKNISANCGISLLAVDERATIPIAYNLTGEMFTTYIGKLNRRLKARFAGREEKSVKID